jgi:hypothetical protein
LFLKWLVAPEGHKNFRQTDWGLTYRDQFT